jgi:hypothetical protein
VVAPQTEKPPLLQSLPRRRNRMAPTVAALTGLRSNNIISPQAEAPVRGFRFLSRFNYAKLEGGW